MGVEQRLDCSRWATLTALHTHSPSWFTPFLAPAPPPNPPRAAAPRMTLWLSAGDVYEIIMAAKTLRVAAKSRWGGRRFFSDDSRRRTIRVLLAVDAAGCLAWDRPMSFLLLARLPGEPGEQRPWTSYCWPPSSPPAPSPPTASAGRDGPRVARRVPERPRRSPPAPRLARAS